MDKIKSWFKKLKRMKLSKMHLDYIAGLLTIPVLLTAILINFTNLDKNKTVTPPPVGGPTSSPNSKVIVITQPVNNTQPTPDAQTCTKSIGPISITYPTEGQNVSDNPLCINIDYSNNNYCSVVWSYRINNGSWSAYNSDEPCLYNLPSGSVQFQLRVQSTVSNSSETLTRNFTYSGTNNGPTPTPTPSNTSTPTQAVASSSAGI